MPATGPGYADGSVALAVDAGSASASSSPVDNDLEFVLKAPARGAAVSGQRHVDARRRDRNRRCAQAAAVSVPLGVGKTLRYATKLQKNGVALVGDRRRRLSRHRAPADQPDACSRARVTRRLTATDQCNPAGAKRVSTKDWELVLEERRVRSCARSRRTRRSRRACATPLRVGLAPRRLGLALARPHLQAGAPDRGLRPGVPERLRPRHLPDAVVRRDGRLQDPRRDERAAQARSEAASEDARSCARCSATARSRARRRRARRRRSARPASRCRRGRRWWRAIMSLP